ncbi:MAG: hypothetical protein WC886_07930 [Saccharofermentanaceae bacterium]|jgi:hypothetical protein
MEQDLIKRIEQLGHVPAIASDYRITSQGEYDEANALLDDLTAKEKQIKKVKEKKYAPAKKALDDLRSIFDNPLKAIGEVKDIIIAEAKRYKRVEDAKRAELLAIENKKKDAEMAALQAKQEAAEAAGKVKTAEKLNAKMVDTFLAPSAVPPAPVKPEGLSRFVKLTGKFGYVSKDGEIVDKPDMNLIPVDWHILDTTALGAIARAPGNKPKIPGIYFYKD